MNLAGLDEKLRGLSLEEQHAVLQILQDVYSNGQSETYNQLTDVDWEEKPVDIITFIHDKRYLGNALYD